MALQQLMQQYPWPEPSVSPRWDGWSDHLVQEMIQSCVTEDTKLIVELGVWLGLTTRTILDTARNATVLCVDHWQGSVEHRENPEWAAQLPTLYDTCVANLFPWKDRIVLMREFTLSALHRIAGCGLKPDLIWVDASHDAQNVAAEVATAISLFPKAQVAGHDWTWASVRLAVQCIAAAGLGTIQTNESSWRLVRSI